MAQHMRRHVVQTFSANRPEGFMRLDDLLRGIVHDIVESDFAPFLVLRRIGGVPVAQEAEKARRDIKRCLALVMDYDCHFLKSSFTRPSMAMSLSSGPFSGRSPRHRR